MATAQVAGTRQGRHVGGAGFVCRVVSCALPTEISLAGFERHRKSAVSAVFWIITRELERAAVFTATGGGRRSGAGVALRR